MGQLSQDRCWHEVDALVLLSLPVGSSSLFTRWHSLASFSWSFDRTHLGWAGSRVASTTMKVVRICTESALGQGFGVSFFLFRLHAGCLGSRCVLYHVWGQLPQDMPGHCESPGGKTAKGSVNSQEDAVLKRDSCLGGKRGSCFTILPPAWAAEPAGLWLHQVPPSLQLQVQCPEHRPWTSRVSNWPTQPGAQEPRVHPRQLSESKLNFSCLCP